MSIDDSLDGEFSNGGTKRDRGRQRTRNGSVQKDKKEKKQLR